MTTEEFCKDFPLTPSAKSLIARASNIAASEGVSHISASHLAKAANPNNSNPESDMLNSTSQLRKHYAGLAMQGIVSSRAYSNGGWNIKDVASRSVKLSEALIAELNKK